MEFHFWKAKQDELEHRVGDWFGFFFERTVVAHVPYLQRLILFLKFSKQDSFFLTNAELLDILLLLLKSD